MADEPRERRFGGFHAEGLGGTVGRAEQDADEVERQLSDLEAERASGWTPTSTWVSCSTACVQLEGVLESGNVLEGRSRAEACSRAGGVPLRRPGRVADPPPRPARGATGWIYPEAAAKDGRKRVDDWVENNNRRYWTDPVKFEKPKRSAYHSWARDHASEVGAKREEEGWTVKRLAEHFGKCRETIDRALEFAALMRSSPANSG